MEYVLMRNDCPLCRLSLVRSRNVLNFGYILYLSLKDKEVEAGELSDAYWNHTLVTNLDTSVSSSPYFLV